MGLLALKYIKRLGLRPEDIRVAIQGFGNVGSHAAKFLHEADFRVVAISDLSGAYYRPDGLDVLGALRHVLHGQGTLEGYREADRLPSDQLLELDVDLLIPAALGDVITSANVGRIRAKSIIEGANGPISPEADAALHERGVTVLPDILANAGGVTVSYFEWVQNRQHYRWPLDRVRQELDRTLSTAFEDVWSTAHASEVSLRTAAFMIAAKRVLRATELKGYV